ncbi:hypothetical protein CR513_06779, partial [Mucuna pruriens]
MDHLGFAMMLCGAPRQCPGSNLATCLEAKCLLDNQSSARDSWSGVFLFATQTNVLSGMPLYHIPKYHIELVVLKKPNSNASSGETRVWLIPRDCVAVKVSAVSATLEKNASKVKV